ncbi:hypothetical protein J6590_082832 [Homalodisca vitripennis]|nr:hypothetical protein J6590_082832 [Homalodisca vitripennis]
MRFLRGIEKTTRRDRIRNEITRERLKVVSLQETMEGRRIQWMGHVKRMGDNRMPRIALEKEEGGRRPRGRPRKQWSLTKEERRLLSVFNRKPVKSEFVFVLRSFPSTLRIFYLSSTNQITYLDLSSRKFDDMCIISNSVEDHLLLLPVTQTNMEYLVWADVMFIHQEWKIFFSLILRYH